MMICVTVVNGDQLQYMVEGGDETQAVQLLVAAAQALTQKLAAEGKPIAPPVSRVPPRPALYLPNGHGHVPGRPPGGL